MAWALARGGDADTRVEPASVYRSAPGPGALGELPPPVTLRVVPGRADPGDPIALELEAILRLHVALGLRDVHHGPLQVAWEPAAWLDEEPLSSAVCGESTAQRWLGPHEVVDPGGRDEDPEDTITLGIRVDVDSERLVRAQVVGCTGSAARFSQIVVAKVGEADVQIRELLIWLSARMGVGDARELEGGWSQLPARSGPPLRAYGAALVGAMAGGPEDLGDAAHVSAEAAWLQAWLGPPELRLDRLERSAQLRFAFTAAVEDAAELVARSDSKHLTRTLLDRLEPGPSRARPVELALAARLLAEGRPDHARLVLDRLSGPRAETTAAARLQSLTLLAAGAAGDAEAWADSWVAAEPDEAEAWLVRGRIDAALGRETLARDALLHAAKLGSDERSEALGHYAALALRTGTVEEFLEKTAPVEGTPADAMVLELRAFVALQAGRPEQALVELDELATRGPLAGRLLLNRCIAALRSGRADGLGLECGEVGRSPWQRAQMALALGSRRPGLLPGYPPELEVPVREQLERAPDHKTALDAAWRVLGPGADLDEQERLAAAWRVAHGGGVALPRLPPQARPEDGVRTSAEQTRHP